MSAPAKVKIHGTGPVLHDWNFLASVSGPDEITFTAQNCPAVDTYTKGQTVPGYTACRIVEARAKLVTGSQYDITCRGRGLITGISRVIARSTGSDALGWDTLTERLMETKASVIPSFGAKHPNNGNMFLMSHSDEEGLDLGDGTSQWCTRGRTYRGLATGTFKLVQRKITVNENIVSPKDPIAVQFPGGWTDYRKAQISFPRIVVEDTVITNAPPRTNLIPGNDTPVNPPTIKSIRLTGADLTWNWPAYWKLASINSEELFRGAGLYHSGQTWEYVWPAQF